jgi:type IV secretion system protein VirD4
MAAEQDTERRLLTPDEALRLPADDLLIFTAGHAPIYGKKIRYYNDKEFTRRARITALTTADQRPPAAPNAPSAGASALPVVGGEAAPAQPSPSLTRARPEASDPPGRGREPADPPGATTPERDTHRTWRRRTAPATGQELDLADQATASSEVVATPEQIPTEHPVLVPDLVNTQRRADEEHPPHKPSPPRERGKELELGR